MARKKAETNTQGENKVPQDTENNVELQNTPTTEIESTKVAPETDAVKDDLPTQEQPLQQSVNNGTNCEIDNLMVRSDITSPTALNCTTDETVATNPTSDTKKTKKDSNEGKASKEETTPEPEIPDTVKNVLKRYPSEEELYIDKFGGIYTKDTQHSLVKNAILYNNPFYNKNK